MHAFLKSKGSSRIGLCEILQGMDVAISALRHIDSQEDYESMWTSPVTNITNLASIEEHVSKIYTRRMFYIFREEMKREGKYIVTAMNRGKNVLMVKLIEYSTISTSREMAIDKVTETYACQCALFESKGIPFRHIFSTIKALHVTCLPESLICKRWMKMPKRLNETIKSNALNINGNSLVEEKLHFGHVIHKCSEIAYIASLDEKVFDHIVEELEKLSGTLTGMTHKMKKIM